jgi:hypothetical protein
VHCFPCQCVALRCTKVPNFASRLAFRADTENLTCVERAEGHTRSQVSAFCKANVCFSTADNKFNMASRKRSLYKPWVHHTNDLLSSLVARGLKISIPSYQTQPTERPTQAINLSKALPPLPSEEDTESPIWEGPETTNLWAKTETKNRFPIQPSHLKRVGALSTTHPANYPDDIITRSSPSTNSSRTVRPLTGIDLNIDSPLLFDDDADDDDDDDSDEDSCHTPDSATYYPSVNMYSQPGVDFDPEMFGYLARRSPMPMSSGILVKSSIYQSPKQLHMNRQPPRALRHTDRPTGSQKTKTLGSEKVCQHQNIANVNTLREIVHQEQLRHDMYTDYSYDARYESEGSEISELEDTSINIGSLVPKPLAIHRKEMRTPSPSNYPLPQISANPWSYGINELALSNIKTPFVPGDSSRPSSKSSQAPTIASPISSTRSDDPVLPLLLVSQSLPTQKSFSETSKYHLNPPIRYYHIDSQRTRWGTKPHGSQGQ